MKREGVWHTDVTVELFNPPRKKRLRVTTNETSLKAARSVLQQKVRLLQQQDREGEHHRMLLHTGLQKYLDDYSSVNVKNFVDHELNFRRLTGSLTGRPGMKDVPIDSLTGGDVASHIATRKRAGFANSTINQEITFLSGALGWLSEHHNVRLPHIRWRKLRLKPFEKKRWATVEQLRNILSNIRSQIDRDLCLLLLSCGARLSECKDLRWSQVSLNEGMLYLYREKVDNEGTLVLTPDCIEMLTRRYNARDETCSYVFQPSVGRGRKRDGKWKRLNQPIDRPRGIDKAIALSGLNDDPILVKKKGKFTIHSLRDSYASILAQSGRLDLNEIRELLGHTTMTMTRKYANLIPSEVTRKATSTFEAVFEAHHGHGQ